MRVWRNGHLGKGKNHPLHALMHANWYKGSDNFHFHFHVRLVQ